MDAIIIKSLEFAKKVHFKQSRCSGEPYIEHPLEVARKLKKFNLAPHFISTAILHDTLEQSDFTKTDLEKTFGTHIATCVFFLSKDFYPTKKERIKNYIQKLKQGFFFCESIYFVKIADVLHNLETLHFLPSSKQNVQIKEVEDYYLPFFSNYLESINLENQLPAMLFLYSIKNFCENFRNKHLFLREKVIQ